MSYEKALAKFKRAQQAEAKASATLRAAEKELDDERRELFLQCDACLGFTAVGEIELINRQTSRRECGDDNSTTYDHYSWACPHCPNELRCDEYVSRGSLLLTNPKDDRFPYGILKLVKSVYEWQSELFCEPKRVTELLSRCRAHNAELRRKRDENIAAAAAKATLERLGYRVEKP